MAMQMVEQDRQFAARVETSPAFAAGFEAMRAFLAQHPRACQSFCGQPAVRLVATRHLVGGLSLKAHCERHADRQYALYEVVLDQPIAEHAPAEAPEPPACQTIELIERDREEAFNRCATCSHKISAHGSFNLICLSCSCNRFERNWQAGERMQA